jgi:hypothetical protein
MAHETSEKVVRISMNGGLPVPDHDPIEVQKNNQKIKWAADFPFKIDIDGYTDVAHGKDGDGPHHAKTGAFVTERKHKYSITANGVTNDPDIIVKP